METVALSACLNSSSSRGRSASTAVWSSSADLPGVVGKSWERGCWNASVLESTMGTPPRRKSRTPKNSPRAADRARARSRSYLGGSDSDDSCGSNKGRKANNILARENRALREQNAALLAQQHACRQHERDLSKRERRMAEIVESLALTKLSLCETEAKRETAAHELARTTKYVESLEAQLVDYKMQTFQLKEQLLDADHSNAAARQKENNRRMPKKRSSSRNILGDVIVMKSEYNSMKPQDVRAAVLAQLDEWLLKNHVSPPKKARKSAQRGLVV